MPPRRRLAEPQTAATNRSRRPNVWGAQPPAVAAQSPPATTAPPDAAGISSSAQSQGPSRKRPLESVDEEEGDEGEENRPSAAKVPRLDTDRAAESHEAALEPDTDADNDLGGVVSNSLIGGPIVADQNSRAAEFPGPVVSPPMGRQSLANEAGRRSAKKVPRSDETAVEPPDGPSSMGVGNLGNTPGHIPTLPDMYGTSSQQGQRAAGSSSPISSERSYTDEDQPDLWPTLDYGDETPAERVVAAISRLITRLRAEEATASLIDNVQELRDLAGSIAAREHYAAVPVFPPNQPHDAVLESLQRAVWAEALMCYLPDWDWAINYAREICGEGLATTMRERRDEMITTFRANPAKPRQPVSVLFHEIWPAFTAAFMAKRPRSNTRARFNDLRQWAMDDERDRNISTFPPAGVTSRTCEELCERLATDIRARRQYHFEWVHEAWENAIHNAANQEEGEALMAERETMTVALRAGAIPYGPYNQAAAPDWMYMHRWGHVAEQLGFDRARSAIDGEWVFTGPLGQGSNGNASLWVRYGPGLQVVDRKVLKETYLALEGDHWNQQWPWSGPISDRVPLEYALARSANVAVGSETVLRLDGYGTYDAMAMYRLYMEYCPHGDLEKMIYEYHSMRFKGIRNEDGALLDHHPPSRVLWAVFEALSAALCIMHAGHLPGQPAPAAAAAHPQFIHRDLKPANIFLATPGADFWPGVPIAKVGDFGIAIPIDDPDSRIQGNGTPGYQSPEQYPYPDTSDFYDNTVVTPKSDVWSMGRIMLSLMEVQIIDALHDATFEGDAVMPLLSPDIRPLYSAELVDLVHACLVANPDARPSSSRVFERIRAEVAVPGPGLYTKSMRMQEGGVDEVVLYHNRSDVHTHLSFT